MLTPELYRYLTLKKNPVIYFHAKFVPPTDAYDKIERNAKAFFSELPSAKYRSSFGTKGDKIFYRNADQNLNREAIVPSRKWVKNFDLSGCQNVIYVEDLKVNVVEDLFNHLKFENLPNYPDFYLKRFLEYCNNSEEEKNELDGMFLSELISVFGNETIKIEPADLVVLYLTDLTEADILWMSQVHRYGIRTLVLSDSQ